MKREPDFNNILKVLKKEVPDRPTLFEFFLNTPLYEMLSGDKFKTENPHCEASILIKSYAKAGYDYATIKGSNFQLDWGSQLSKKSKSQNSSSCIYDRESFEKYKWISPDDFDYSQLEKAKEYLPDGMKLIVWGPGGILENVTEIVGYDNLCYMIADDEELITEIFNNVGKRFLRYYQLCAEFDTVGALISNDDWGYKTQTLLSPADLKKYVFPWHKKIVEIIHKASKPAILHSCGKLDSVYDEIINNMYYDGKHSYEDAICPVEEAYELLAGKIAVLGGIDVDFICRQNPDAIKKRCSDMLERSKDKGGYALGTGNSIADYVPVSNYFAMLSACGISIDI